MVCWNVLSLWGTPLYGLLICAWKTQVPLRHVYLSTKSNQASQISMTEDSALEEDMKGTFFLLTKLDRNHSHKNLFCNSLSANLQLLLLSACCGANCNLPLQHITDVCCGFSGTPKYNLSRWSAKGLRKHTEDDSTWLLPRSDIESDTFIDPTHAVDKIKEWLNTDVRPCFLRVKEEANNSEIVQTGPEIVQRGPAPLMINGLIKVRLPFTD